MKNFIRLSHAMPVLFFVGSLLLPATATAQATPANVEFDKWQLTAAIYGYIPTIKGTVNHPGGSGSTDVDLSMHDVLDALKMGAIGGLAVHNGSWGLFTDVLYMDLGASKSTSQNLSVGNVTVPGTTDTNIDLKAVVWTLAGEYRVVSDPAWKVDLFAGARMLYLEPSVDYQITIPGASISGSKSASGRLWDGIVGIKGRYAFGDDQKWFVPFYADVGAGENRLTWQAFAGVGYSYGWGDVVATWRYMEWDGKSGAPVAELDLNGPAIGVLVRW